MTITFKITKAGQPVATRTLKPPLTADEATVVLQRLDDSWIGGLCAEGKQDDFLPPREKLAEMVPPTSYICRSSQVGK